ncbi:MAG: acid--CoA ligase [Acetobacteraceae bacterium]|nr:acid--CoA ligase [Acetobacteraceae bacterium]
MTTQHFDWIAHHAANRGEQLAMVDLATSRAFTYTAFDDRAGRLASGLRAEIGVARGDRVAVLAHNSSDLFEIQFARARLGAVFVPLNWRLTVPELRFIVGDCAPVVLIHDPEFTDAATELAATCGIAHLRGRDPGDSAYERLIAAGEAGLVPEPLTHDDIETILYTSGTTGHPKGAIITHGMRFWQTVNLTGPTRVTADSVALVTLPQFHVGGLDVFANPAFHYGGKVVVMRGYDPALCLRLLTDPVAGITHVVGAPAHYLFMSQLPEFETASFSPNLIACIAAAPVPVAQIRLWDDHGLSLLQGYGMTEARGVITMLDPVDRIRKAGSAGKACLHVAVRLMRGDGTDTAVGEMGEIWVKSPSITPGYWKNDEANRTAFTDGWFRTGDAALIDEDGFYYIVDRWKDMYISGGENVYPAEVEEVLFKLEGIAEAAIIGVPDERWGEVGRAIVALKPGVTVAEAEIMRHCDANLARYKQPRSVRFVEALPRNATGKVHKPTLRRLYGDA